MVKQKETPKARPTGRSPKGGHRPFRGGSRPDVIPDYIQKNYPEPQHGMGMAGGSGVGGGCAGGQKTGRPLPPTPPETPVKLPTARRLIPLGE